MFGTGYSPRRRCHGDVFAPCVHKRATCAATLAPIPRLHLPPRLSINGGWHCLRTWYAENERRKRHEQTEKASTAQASSVRFALASNLLLRPALKLIGHPSNGPPHIAPSVQQPAHVPPTYTRQHGSPAIRPPPLGPACPAQPPASVGIPHARAPDHAITR